MKQEKTNQSQKIKDNIFYVAFGIGILALLAVVTVYTMQQRSAQVAEMDLNTVSDYSEITQKNQKIVEQTGGDVSSDYEDTTKTATRENTRENTTEESTLADAEASTEAASVYERDYALPTTAPAGELTFNSEETLSWPVNGEVILPYSMDTTVYFKTLDQYQCNPGMMIAAGSGTTVKSAYLGRVTKVTSDDVYGNIVTVYLGNDYSAVYGQLDTIYVSEGDYVKAGDSIGTVGNPTDTFLEEGSHVFFQMLNGDTPVDPMLFIE